MPESEIIYLMLNLINTKFKNDPEKKERAKLLLKLEPYPTRSTSETAQLAKDGLIDKLDFVIKSNLHTFISRFEDENGNLLVFGENLRAAEKVKAIKEGLREYAQEMNLGLDMMQQPEAVTSDLEGEAQNINEEAQAKLRGSVGGVAGILDIQRSVSEGVTNYDAAIKTLILIYGFSEADAKSVLGKPPKLKNIIDENSIQNGGGQ